MRNIVKSRWLILSCIGLFSCKQFLTIDLPIDQINNKKVYESDETAQAAIRGIYARMMNNGGFASGGGSSITLLAGRSSDEFINYYSLNENTKQFSENNLTSDNATLKATLWQDPYQIIYASNAILENLGKPGSSISVPLKRQLAAEAKFIRAFCYFYLTNLFGNIPLILSTDYHANSSAFASIQQDIYKQIIKDLVASKAELNENYPATDRTRANKWVATALLARVYLYTGDWKKAETESSMVISQESRYSLVADLNQVFLKNSKEAILQFFVPTALSVNTFEGLTFILTAAPSSSTAIVLDDKLVAAFEPGDQRKSKWIGTLTSGTSSWHYPFKYKIRTGSASPTEYSMVLRLAEQYCIRAEARIRQGDIENGIKDLNTIRTRARAVISIDIPDPLPDLSLTLNEADALLAVEKERRIEFFSEWAHRWLDLKRTNRAEAVLGVLKGSNWQNTDTLYPIPATELINNPNLNQNNGYY